LIFYLGSRRFRTGHETLRKLWARFSRHPVRPGEPLTWKIATGWSSRGALSGMVIAEIVRQVQRAVVRIVGSDIGWIDWKEL